MQYLVTKLLFKPTEIIMGAKESIAGARAEFFNQSVDETRNLLLPSNAGEHKDVEN